MPRKSIAQYLNPWKFKREQQQRFDRLRERDGDSCGRCRRPMRFDLPAGHDQGAAVEPIVSGAGSGSEELDQFRLCHARCNPSGVDHTGEVLERARRKNEAELFAMARKNRAA